MCLLIGNLGTQAAHLKLVVRAIKKLQITLARSVTLSLMQRAFSPRTWALKGNAKNTESLTGMMPRTTLRDNFLLTATQALSQFDGPRADGTGEFRGYTPAVFFESIMDQTQQVTRQCDCVAERFPESWDCVQKVKSSWQLVLRKGLESEVETERVPGRCRQVISHPSRGAEATDSAVLDSKDKGNYGCTRFLPAQGHSFSSASQRESAVESAQHR